MGRRRKRLAVRFFMGFVLFLHAVTDFGSWETGNGWKWCFSVLSHSQGSPGLFILFFLFKALLFLGRRVDACLQLLPCSGKIVLMACRLRFGFCLCSTGFSPILT